MSHLPIPIGKQREVLYLPAKGHTVVLGTAGSGKTTLAILRAAYLADPSTEHCGNTLLITFNRALVTYLRHLRPAELRNVSVENYHAFARGYLNYRNKMPDHSILSDPTQKKNLIVEAIKEVGQYYAPHPFFERPLEFFLDEIQWLQHHGITTVEIYKTCERVGRIHSRISQDFREIMFEIFQQYLSLRENNNKLYDWDDLALHAYHELQHDGSDRLYRHIVIDEGQDFSPTMLRSLADAIPTYGSLTFFGDVAQQIYGQRMSWRSAGLEIREIYYFKENYRNTREIARLGLAISQMSYFRDISDMVEPTNPRVEGTRPTIIQCNDMEQEIEQTVRLAIANASHLSIAILFKNRDQEELISRQLPDNCIRLHRNMPKWQTGAGIRYGTYHAAKGLEFDMVILPFLSMDNLPDSDRIENFGKNQALTYYGRLLYVAVTRAKTNLVLLYSEKVTELLPRDHTLYKIISL